MKTTPLQKELQKLEADHLKLSRQHQKRLNDLKSEINLLGPKAEGLRQLVTKLESEARLLINSKNDFNIMIGDLEREVKKLNECIALKELTKKNLNVESEVLTQLIEKQQGIVDSKLEDYSKNRRIEIESTLVEKQNELKEVEEKLETAHRTTLELSERANKQNVDFEHSRLDQQIKMDAFITDQNKAKQELEHLERKIDNLNIQVKELSYQKATFESTIEKIRLEGKQFADYEVKARKILENKDRELQEREQNIQIGEQHLQTRRSFLPKL